MADTITNDTPGVEEAGHEFAPVTKPSALARFEAHAPTTTHGEGATNQDATMGQALAAHASQTEWKYRELVANLYVWFARLNEGFFESRLPAAIISIDRTNRRNLGWYRPWRDGLALRHRINLNSTYAYRDPSERLGILLHEMIHLEQDIDGKVWVRRQKHHDRKFRERAAALGIPTTGRGHWLGITPGSRFVKLLDKHGVRVVAPTPELTSTAAASRATSVSWTCACTKAWVARGRLLVATCNACDQQFVRTEPRGRTP